MDTPKEKKPTLSELAADVEKARLWLGDAEAAEREATRNTRSVREAFNKATAAFDAAVDAMRKENAVADTDWGRRSRQHG